VWVGGVQGSLRGALAASPQTAPAGPGALSRVLTLLTARRLQRGVDRRDLGEAERVAGTGLIQASIGVLFEVWSCCREGGAEIAPPSSKTVLRSL